MHWEPGHELTLVTTEAGVLLKSSAPEKTLRLEDLRGFIDYDGPPIPIEELCKPVDYGDDWEASERRNR